MKNLILIPILFFTLHLSAQECDTRIYDAAEQAQLEKNIQNHFQKSEPECTKIRTVIHVIYNGKVANTNYNGWISEEQVLSQIRITNQFFRNDSLMYHADNTPLGYEMELATTDPDGNPTNGIVYHDGYALFGERWATYGLKHSHPQAISEVVVANTIGWNTNYIPPYLDDRERYLNVYVVSAIDGNTGEGVQGYAYFPTTNAVYGNYVLFNAFGAKQLDPLTGPPNFNLKPYTSKGFTWTHELLHNFGLFHTFQGNSCTETNCTVQGDRVCDTPPQTVGAGCLGSCGFVSENVMDYLSQNCKNRITAGQVARANAVINVNLKAYKVCAECDGFADLNGDGVVNILDFSLLSTAFNCAMGDACYNPAYDLNCDGVINILDFSILSSQFHNVVTVAAVRELHEAVELYNIVGQRVRLRDRMPVGVYILIIGEVATKIIIKE